MNYSLTSAVLSAFLLLLTTACKKDSASKNELWPKTGYLFSTDSDTDTVYVEAGNMAVTSRYSSAFPLQDPAMRWTISLAGSGNGVLIHNDDEEYWSIDSTFHPGLQVEQLYVSIVKVNNTSNISDHVRFKYHKSINDNQFYLESVRYPGMFVTAIGHAESGRGLLLRKQSNGDWEFWLNNQ